jgi:hypothetical protein
MNIQRICLSALQTISKYNVHMEATSVTSVESNSKLDLIGMIKTAIPSALYFGFYLELPSWVGVVVAFHNFVS